MRGERPLENGDGEVDEQYWAKAAEEQQRTGTEEVEGGLADTLPFPTQFFDDDDDGPAYADNYEAAIGDIPPILPGEQDLLAQVEGQERRVKPAAVNFAKRAKRVDVRKLKENIWRGLEIVIPPKKNEDEMVCSQVHELLRITDCANRIWTTSMKTRARTPLSLASSIKSYRALVGNIPKRSSGRSARASVSFACCILRTSRALRLTLETRLLSTRIDPSVIFST